MKNLLLIACAIIFFSFRVSAQWVSVFDLRESIPDIALYRFPKFTDATIIFRNGIISSAKLNYNISNDEMRFINQKADTLVVTNAPTINFISISGSRFYYDRGYLQTIDSASDIVLAYRQVLTQKETITIPIKSSLQHEKEMPYPFYRAGGLMYKFDDEDKDLVTSIEYYFFGDGYGNFFKADKDFILTHFKNNQPAVRTFLKENHINFYSLKDLHKLMQFCRSLS
jgi:hypothetical protein